MRTVVRPHFRIQRIWCNEQPGFAEKSDKSHPVFIGNLGSFQRAEEGHVDLCIVISLSGFLLGPHGSDKVVKLSDVFIDSVTSKFHIV